MAEDLWVIGHIGFFLRFTGMNKTETDLPGQLARSAARLQEQRTGHAPASVSVVIGEDMLIVTLHDALTPAEKVLASSAAGAARVQEFHRQLFASSSNEMQLEIWRITGRQVREAAAEIDPTTGAVVHAFTTGTMVQVFQLTNHPLSALGTDSPSLDRAEDDGLRPDLQAPSTEKRTSC